MQAGFGKKSGSRMSARKWKAETTLRRKFWLVAKRTAFKRNEKNLESKAASSLTLLVEVTAIRNKVLNESSLTSQSAAGSNGQ